MTDAQQGAAAKKFAEFWKGKGYEKGQSQPFCLSLLRDVYFVPHPEQFAEFESKAHIVPKGAATQTKNKLLYVALVPILTPDY